MIEPQDIIPLLILVIATALLFIVTVLTVAFEHYIQKIIKLLKDIKQQLENEGD